MLRVPQFILLASLAISCCSYSLSRKTSRHLKPEVPPELMDSKIMEDFIYPREYMDKLFAALSPAEQKNLITSKIHIGDRGSTDSDADKHNCSLHIDFNHRPELLRAVEDNEYHVVFQNEVVIQKYKVQVCDGDYTCNVKFKKGESGCCYHIEEIIPMTVASVPYNKKTDKYSGPDRLVEKPMLLKTKCSCISFKQNMNDLNRKPNCNLQKRLA